MISAKVSVIVPIYNTEKYLERCVDSLLVQTYKNIEIILVDDGSTDSSPVICDCYAVKDARVKVIHKQNGGLSSARNAGIDIASGEYIGFVDSDDYVSADMYKVLVERLEDSDCEIANIMYVRVDPDKNIYPSRVFHDDDCIITSKDFAREIMLHKGDESVCTKLFKNDIFKKLRFCESKLNEDLLFIVDAFSIVRNIAFVSQIGYNYFVRNGSISSGYGKSVIDMVGNSIYAKKKVSKYFPMLKEEAFRFAIYQHMAYLLLVPNSDATKENDVYIHALSYIRRNAIKSIFNKYLTIKNKVTILLQTIFPHQVAKIYQNM